ncbi:MAG TPA: [acyl-carrier-protein] S-malonyltransferase [bacterium]|nr:[acyl-carrier-protein] S-malonyltransferase [bacterium]
MALVFVFPGQGAQYVGMGLGLYEGNERANAVLSEAESAFGGGLLDVMFKGPEEELKKTDYTQPAIFALSAAIYEVVREKYGAKPAFFAGHSLGEYTALYAAGAFDFKSAMELVKIRGKLMQEASLKIKSSMAAVLGLDAEAVKELCARVKDAGYLAAANINAPGQIVVSGDMAAINAAEAAAKELGAKRYIKLSVAGAFHSDIMAPAADGLKRAMESFTFSRLSTPVVANASASRVVEPQEIKDSLVKQVVSPVRWIETVEYLKEHGAGTFVECGPGNVLTGLVKKIDRSLKTVNYAKLEDINSNIL